MYIYLPPLGKDGKSLDCVDNDGIGKDPEKSKAEAGEVGRSRYDTVGNRTNDNDYNNNDPQKNGNIDNDNNKPEVVRWKGGTYIVEKASTDDVDILHEGSIIAFSKNGVWQGVAYKDIRRGSYYAAASIYTLPDQVEGASIQLVAGPEEKLMFQGDMMHPSGYPRPRVLSELQDDEIAAEARNALDNEKLNLDEGREEQKNQEKKPDNHVKNDIEMVDKEIIETESWKDREQTEINDSDDKKNVDFSKDPFVQDDTCEAIDADSSLRREDTGKCLKV